MSKGRNLLYIRILALIFAAISLVIFLTSVFYTFITPKSLVTIKANELMPVADIAANHFALYLSGLASPQQVIDSLQFAETAVNAKIILMVKSSNIPWSTSSEDIDNVLTGNEQLNSRLMSRVDIVMQGEKFTDQIPVGDKENNVILFIGNPITNSSTGEIVGAAIVLKMVKEIYTALSGLNKALLLSMLFGFLIIIPLVFLGVKRTLKPLVAMKIVALTMANGDFSVKADESDDDEIGQLGMTLNYLSRRLSKTISELVIERNRLEQILNGLSEGIVACDKEGNITHINPAINELFGSGENALQSTDVIPFEVVWKGFADSIAQNSQKSFNVNVGETIISVSIAPLINKDEEVVGAVGLFIDITETEKLEQTRRDYVANVSHELRTPLTAIRGLVEPLKDGLVKSDEKRSSYYDILLRETMRLNRLIDDLLELSRLQAGNMAFEMYEFEISDVISNILDQFESQATSKNISFTAKVDENCPKVFGNPDRTEQVLTILLDNAFKFTEEKGTIDIFTRLSHTEDKILVSVRDSGCGISKDNLEHIFERFYKADKARTSSGTGLGLSIACEMLSLLKEEIFVESELDVGTTFTFTLTGVPSKENDSVDVNEVDEDML